MITDQTGRRFQKLRISLTNQCNYACVYCSENGVDTKNQQSLETSKLLGMVALLHKTLNLKAVRLTGGEPLLNLHIIQIVEQIKSLGIHNIGMTTNGHYLSGKAAQLKNAGLNSVNISLDGLTEESFKKLSRKYGLVRVLEAIDVSVSEGLKVKINTVVVAGQNDNQILPLIEFAMQKGIVIRFLELMSMGALNRNKQSMFFSENQMLEIISKNYSIEEEKKEENSTARYWKINGKRAFGIIANDSTPFCSDCDRLRLDSFGNIYGCLSSLIPLKLEPEAKHSEIQTLLLQALKHKQQVHFTGNARTMKSIGG